MYHGECIRFTVIIMMGIRDARDLKNKKLNTKNVQGINVDFIFTDLDGGVGTVVKASIWNALTCRNLSVT